MGIITLQHVRPRDRNTRSIMPMSMRLVLLLVALVVALLVAPSAGMKQQWRFELEDRREFLIERFGFAPQAKLQLRVQDVFLALPEPDSTMALEKASARVAKTRAGLLFIHEAELWGAIATLQGDRETLDGDENLVSASSSSPCLLENRTQRGLWVDFTNATTWVVDQVVDDDSEPDRDIVTTDEAAKNKKLRLRPGFYYLFYTQCTPGLRTSFSMDGMFRNQGGNYLSAGDSALPTVYLIMTFVFITALITWLRVLRMNQIHLLHVHHLMTAVVVIKIVALFAESMRYYYMKRHGDTLTSWTAVFYVFMFLKGVMLFTVLLLIGMGWSLMNSHLSRREKSLLSVVLVLQVLSNTAMIVMEESSVGTQSWVAWRDVLHAMDILCCFTILLPIIWSIRALREAAHIDGKAHLNLQKLTQFRSFYLLVITYIYVTRIALYLLAASLPYTATWVSVAVSELAALAFFVLTGYRFRPLALNPYLELATTHIDALDEFGLDDDDVELQNVPIQRKDHARFNVLHLRPPSPRKTRPTAL